MKQVARVVGSLIVGYLGIVIGAIVGQDLLFGGVSSYEGTPAATLWIAGGLTTLGAVAGGAAMAWISKSRPWISVTLLGAWLAFERTYLARQTAHTGEEDLHGDHARCKKDARGGPVSGEPPRFSDYDAPTVPAAAWPPGKGHSEVALELITGGADCNLIDQHSVTALIWAARLGRTEIVRRLLAAGVD